MTTTTEPTRAWTGPAILTFGFRPFLFGAAVWAMLAMVFWVPMQSGHLMLPTAFDPLSWHAQEFLFGYLGAVVAGFLLTAVPNWTGRLPIVGWRLGVLAGLWLAGRLAVCVSGGLTAGQIAVADLAFPVVFALAIGREIVAGRNWRNLIVLAMLGDFILGNALFHWEAARGDHAAQGYGLGLGLGTAIMMIAVKRGRRVPSITSNWLVKRRSSVLPVPPMQSFDKAALVALVVSLALWVGLPLGSLTGVALALAGVLHALRLTRRAGHRTFAEPLVKVLHAGYAVFFLSPSIPVRPPLRPWLRARLRPSSFCAGLFRPVTGRAGLAHRGGGRCAPCDPLGLGTMTGPCATDRQGGGLPYPGAVHRAPKSVLLGVSPLP
ncbi:MAG: short-chain dehydrogenase [Alphaproteobacteria bacterium HGW-Alphaproteobacteria-6]|nr:MAG: short-chain dehydrogenase [Alphaproteobacteria bacterium HGW-Alphaproteobacteria-6]